MGLAGTGKSTIARTIAREYFDQKLLGASFIFSRGGGDASHAGKFFTTIALELAEKSTDLKDYIYEAVTEHTNIANEALRDQWRHLILQPISKFNSNFSRLTGNLPPFLVIVIDALDECDNEKNVETIVQLFAEVPCFSNVRLRILMTSKPEIPIRRGFDEVQSSGRQDFVLHSVLHAIPSEIVDGDIEVYFKEKFEKLRKEQRFPEDWPGLQSIRVLVEKAAGLFIWAATAYRFVCASNRYARDKLSFLLEGRPSETGMGPEEQLNELYLTLLESSISQYMEEEEREKFCKTLKATLGAIVILFSPLSPLSLERLLRRPENDVVNTLDNLHSIVDVPQDTSGTIRLHHPSFRDFLLNKERCNDPRFAVEEKEAHETLADSCLQLMSENLARNSCGLHSPRTLAREAQEEIKQCLPMDLQYACVYWVQHVQKSEARLQDDGKVHKFLQEHFLHWLEASSLTGKTSEAVLALISLDSMDAVGEMCRYISKNLTPIPRVRKDPDCRHLFMMQNDLLYTTNQSLKKLHSNYITLLLSLRRKRVLFDSISQIRYLNGSVGFQKFPITGALYSRRLRATRALSGR